MPQTFVVSYQDLQLIFSNRSGYNLHEKAGGRASFTASAVRTVQFRPNPIARAPPFCAAAVAPHSTPRHVLLPFTPLVSGLRCPHTLAFFLSAGVRVCDKAQKLCLHRKRHPGAHMAQDMSLSAE